jgi:hypothetical protein
MSRTCTARKRTKRWRGPGRATHAGPPGRSGLPTRDKRTDVKSLKPEEAGALALLRIGLAKGGGASCLYRPGRGGGRVSLPDGRIRSPH